MLFAAPFVLFLAFTHAVFKKVEQSGVSIADALTATFSHAINVIKYTKLGGARGGSSIILLDPSGKSINELYGDQSKDDNIRQIVVVAERLIGDAVDMLASDILINPAENFEYDIRFRIDGALRP
jgi:type II secretory ATPase GspE/PulE/Tfp pilus assembly ATPase PilB-like protein